MVVPLRPGKFYGSSLPRPRFYTDVKLSDERVDPPLPVLDPLLSWANDAHWSMGGLSFKRLRLQGKIEGNVKKLRKEREQFEKNKVQNSTPISQWKTNIKTRKGRDRVDYDSPPPAPIAKKRRKREIFTDDEEDDYDDDEEEIEIKTKKKRRRLVRKLGDDFELVVSENKKRGSCPLKDLSHESVSDGIGLRTRSRRSMMLIEEEEEDDNGGKKINTKEGEVEIGKAEKSKEKKNGFVSPIGSRSSPRLKKNLS